MNTNFKVIGLTRLGIKPESTAQETGALYHSAIRDLETKATGFVQSRPIAPLPLSRDNRIKMKLMNEKCLFLQSARPRGGASRKQ